MFIIIFVHRLHLHFQPLLLQDRGQLSAYEIYIIVGNVEQHPDYKYMIWLERYDPSMERRVSQNQVNK